MDIPELVIAICHWFKCDNKAYQAHFQANDTYAANNSPIKITTLQTFFMTPCSNYFKTTYT